MALHDEATKLEEAREEGIEQTKIENARNLFDVLDDETISKRIKLDLDKVKKLRGNNTFISNICIIIDFFFL